MSSITIGPLYYYYVAFFYWITNLHFIASPIIALVSASINFGIIICRYPEVIRIKNGFDSIGYKRYICVFYIFRPGGRCR